MRGNTSSTPFFRTAAKYLFRMFLSNPIPLLVAALRCKARARFLRGKTKTVLRISVASPSYETKISGKSAKRAYRIRMKSGIVFSGRAVIKGTGVRGSAGGKDQDAVGWQCDLQLATAQCEIRKALWDNLLRGIKAIVVLQVFRMQDFT